MNSWKSALYRAWCFYYGYGIKCRVVGRRSETGWFYTVLLEGEQYPVDRWESGVGDGPSGEIAKIEVPR